MNLDAQQHRAMSAADVLDRIGAGLIDLNVRLQASADDEKARQAVLELFNQFVEATLTELTDLSMQIRPARIVRPDES